MKNTYIKTVGNALLISVIGVFGIDYFSHLFFSDPMETFVYFLAKLSLYVVFSVVFLSFVHGEKKELFKVVVAGVFISLLWGTYYNILPLLLGYYPFGIPLAGLTFWGMGFLGTGVAFGTVHTIAFIGGYYASKYIFKYFEGTNSIQSS